MPDNSRATKGGQITRYQHLPHGLDPVLKFLLAHDEDQSMKRSRFSEEQIIGILKEHEASVSGPTCAGGMASATPASTNGKPSSGGWRSRRPSG